MSIMAYYLDNLCRHVALHNYTVADALLDQLPATQINDFNTKGETLLTLLARQSADEYDAPFVHKLWHKAGLDVNRPNYVGQLPLGVALHHQSPLATLLLQHPDINVLQADTYGQTPFWFAVVANDELHVRQLLDWPGININQAETRAGHSPLHEATARGLTNMVALLLARPDINVNQASLHGQTPLMYTQDCMALLLAHSAINVHAVDMTGRTALHHAVICDQTNHVVVLLAHSSLELNQMDTSGATPLHLALQFGWYMSGSAELLLQQPTINVNVMDTKGRTPLYMAITYGLLRVVEQLLAHPALQHDLFPWRAQHVHISMQASYCTTYFELAQHHVTQQRRQNVIKLQDRIMIQDLLCPPKFWQWRLKPGVVNILVQRQVALTWQLTWQTTLWQGLPQELVLWVLTHLRTY